VIAAGSGDSAAARSALGALCDTYWRPIYAYVRRAGAGVEDAQDLTQGFLTSLLDRRTFEGLRQENGRLRAYLLACLKHYLANDAARRRTLKRGAGASIIPLGFDSAEGQYSVEPADVLTPERLYERRWALTVIDNTLHRLREEWERAGRGQEFDLLKSCLLGQAPPGGYTEVALTLQTSEGAIKTAVHRLRRRFQEQLRSDISDTVADASQIDEEIRHLIRALNA
jgi:RNA polymerase sigma-70 factor (ECF subfamily)